MYKNKNILVTGGCGSIGIEIVRYLLACDPKTVRILERSESAYFKIKKEIQSKQIRPLIGDIRDRDRLDLAMENIDIVFHAAAMKHEALCEYNPAEAISVNVIGTQNLVDAAIKHDVKVFIGISTLRAVNPTSTMGATKLLSEKIISNASVSHGKKIRFGCVRFGNVLATSGSVIPVFEKQIKEGDTITITSRNMARFFMSISDAVELVHEAAYRARFGEIFILKMNAMKIIDLAEVLVEELAPLYGKDPKKITFKIIGTRPGEKEHEPLVTKEESFYISDKYGMYIVHNPRHLQHGHKTSIDQMPHLNKKEIRKMLHNKKIL